jgi:hypothetical protein
MDWPHLHLALNHAPVFGVPAVVFLLLWGRRRGLVEVQRLSLWLCVALFVATMVAKVSGDNAAERVAGTVDLPKEIVSAHEQWADRATTGAFALAVAAGVALFRSRGGRPLAGWVLPVIVALAAVTFALLAATANFGGEIRHPEIRRVP